MASNRMLYSALVLLGLAPAVVPYIASYTHTMRQKGALTAFDGALHNRG
jgi:hypothetical protein